MLSFPSGFLCVRRYWEPHRLPQCIFPMHKKASICASGAHSLITRSLSATRQCRTNHVLKIHLRSDAKFRFSIPVSRYFEYAESELLAVESELKAPGENEYGRIDRVADWFLLARMYLNAESWIHENKYQEAYTYAKKVVTDGHYPLASDYREIFLADNKTCKEIIWGLVQDGQRAQSSAGTNFYVKAFVNGPMDELYKTGVGSRGWGNVRAKMTLVDAFDADDVAFDVNDTWGNGKKDKRAQFMTALPNQVKETWDSELNMTSTFTCGYGYIKWRNVTKDDQLCASGDAYTSIDFPLFPHRRCPDWAGV